MSWTVDAAGLPGLTPAPNALPAIGALVTVVGHPGLYDGLSLEHQYTTGLVTATDLSGTLASVPAFANAGMQTLWASGWSTDAVAWHGNSGGPVFDANGNWIGVLVGAFNGGPDNQGPDLSVALALFGAPRSKLEVDERWRFERREQHREVGQARHRDGARQQRPAPELGDQVLGGARLQVLEEPGAHEQAEPQRDRGELLELREVREPGTELEAVQEQELAPRPDAGLERGSAKQRPAEAGDVEEGERL